MRSIVLSALAVLFVTLGCASEETTGGSGPGGAGPSTGGTGGTGAGPSSTGGGGNPTTGGMGGIGGTGGTGGTGGSVTTGVDPMEYPPESEMNGTLATANPLADGTLGFQAEISSVNDVDVFSVFGPLGATLSARISDGNGSCPDGASFTISIYEPSNLEIATAAGGCPQLDGGGDPDLGALAAEGMYFVRVSSSVVMPFYVLELAVVAPECGDGIEQPGEECDDNNTAPADGCEPDCTITPVCGDGSIQTGEECDDAGMAAGDGCDASCQLEGNFCSEGNMPNDGTVTATSLAGCLGGVGTIDPIGDQDYFEVVVGTAGSSLRAEVTTLAGNACPAGFDSYLRMYDASGVELGSDDDDGIDSCSLITPADAFAVNLAAGTYYLRVEDFANNETQGLYALRVTVSAPGCGDGIVQMGEACDDANMIDTDGCSNTCAVLTCAPTETLVTFSATDVPVAIPDTNVAVMSQVNVPATGLVKKLAVTVNIDHNYLTDVDMSLDAPGAPPIVLANDVGSFNSDYANTVFSSQATVPIANGMAPYTGVFVPQGSMASILNTSVTGSWQLSVADDDTGVVGSILGFTVSACVE